MSTPEQFSTNSRSKSASLWFTEVCPSIRVAESEGERILALSALSEGIYAKLSLSSGKRSILEELDRSGRRSIAEMVQARAPATRQYVQRLVSELVDSGFVSLSENEQDRRSKVVALTEKGCTLLATIRPEENMLVRELAHDHRGPEIADALVTLQSISAALQPVGTIVQPV